MTDINLSPSAKMYVLDRIARGYGWEDILVKCRRIPALSTVSPEAIRSMVLKARRPGGASGALSTLEAGGGSTRD